MNVRKILSCAALLLMCARTASAQELAPYEIEPTGKQYEIRLGPNQRSLKAISVYFVSTGNVSNAVMIDLMGPVGIKGAVLSGSIGALDGATALAGGASLRQTAVRTYPDKKEAQSFATASSYDPLYGYVAPWFHLSRDACGKKTDRYVAQVKLDLTGIAPELYDNIFSIVISVKESKYQGKPVASIKPSSDGQYHGEPILLMNTVGYGDEYVNKVTWKNGKVVATTRLSVAKYVGYMGYGLSLIRIKNVLKGGKHTWEQATRRPRSMLPLDSTTPSPTATDRQTRQNVPRGAYQDLRVRCFH
jgi:putative lipoic acid-binding regulatory protein